MKRLSIVASIVFLTLAIFGCGSRGGSSSSETSGSETAQTPTATAATKLDITPDNYVLETNGVDSTTLTIITRDSNNAAVGDITVSLEASAGLLETSQVTTDSDTGIAIVTFSSGPEKTNQVVTITASSGSLTKTVPITLLGTTLSLTSTKSSLLAGVGDSTVMTVKALDANDNPIPGAQITLSSALGNSMTSSSGPGSTVVLTTDTNGKATTTLSAISGPGTETISASGMGAQTTRPLTITNAQFGFTSPEDGTILPVNDSTTLTVNWYDASGNPVDNETLTFTVNGGYFDGVPGRNFTTAQTGGITPGQATVTYTASSTASPVEITVSSASNESDTLQLSVAATDADQLTLQAAPTILAPSVGGVSSTSTITAIVQDGNGQAVANETVVFTLISGPGGGETLSPGTAETDAGGQASVTFTSGSAVSAQEGVVIRASLLSDPSLFADTTLTIGQQATRIVFGLSNKILKYSVDGVEMGYQMPITVLVTDNNGNPIKNQTVNLGIYPLVFKTGYWVDITDPDSPRFVTGQFLNEDLDRNGFVDKDYLEDGAKGFYTFTDIPTLAFDSDGDGKIEQETVDVDADEDGTKGEQEIWYDNVLPAYFFDKDDVSGYHQLVSCSASPYCQANVAVTIDGIDGTLNVWNNLPTDASTLPDLASLGFTGNRFLDPGNVASIPTEVTTDENGLALFKVTYAKSYALWVDVEIRATTSVFGSDASAKLEDVLYIEVGDTPWINSPFGN